MTCKGCQERGDSIRAWIIRKLGIDRIIRKQGKTMTAYTDRELAGLRADVARNDARIRDLVLAGSKLEQAIGTLDNGIVSVSTELAERLDVIRTSVNETRAVVRVVSEQVRYQRADNKALSARVDKIEFPGFEPVSKP